MYSKTEHFVIKLKIKNHIDKNSKNNFFLNCYYCHKIMQKNFFSKRKITKMLNNGYYIRRIKYHLVYL